MPSMVPTPTVADHPEERTFPDVILKSQFFDFIGGRVLSSEQRLMLAVLTDAINVMHDGNRSARMRGRNCFVEARSWIFEAGARCPLSFESVCDALAIDAGALRARIRTMILRESREAGGWVRLQLKENSRFHRMSAKRVRRRVRHNRASLRMTE